MLGLTASDYALWTWTLSHGPHGLAVGAGLTLPLLLLALVRMGLAGGFRMVGHLLRRRPVPSDVRRYQERGQANVLSGNPWRTSANPAGAPSARVPAHAGPAGATDKLAA
jgi:hypothetical protein